MYKRFFITTAALLISLYSSNTVAKGSINTMQSCQASIDFIQQKLLNPPPSYQAKDITVIKTGLNQYDSFIEKTVINPGLKAYYKNADDIKKAKQQINHYQKSLVAQLNQRYPDNKLYTDHAIMLNNCAKEVAPEGKALVALKLALETIIKLAKQ